MIAELWNEYIEIKNPNLWAIIYWLYKWDELVYIWQSWVWAKRIWEHRDKDFDTAKIWNWPECIADRLHNETLLIYKYQPKYNKEKWIRHQITWEWYVNLETIRENLKKNDRYDITWSLKVMVKNNCRFQYVWKELYVFYDDIKEILENKYMFYFN